MGDDPVFLALPDSCHQQNAGRDAGAAQRQAFRGIGHAQPTSAFGFKRARAFDRAVAVTVGFDHGTNGDACADVLLYRVKILSERSQRNFRPSPAVENQRAALRYFRQIGTRCVHVADYSDRTSRVAKCQW